MKQSVINTWESIGQNLTEKWNNLKSTSKTTFDNIGNSIKESWSNIKTNVKESAENVKANIVNAWTKAKENMVSAWDNMKSNAQSSAQSISGSIKEKFSNIQNTIRSFGPTAQNLWSNAWEGMKNKVTSVLGSIKGTISSVFSWISSTIGSLGNSLRSLTSGLFSFGSTKTTISGNTSSRYSRAAMPTSLYSSPAFAALNNVEIPKLATGAIIPANREFLAVLGDQKHGTNIEAPLETIMQANEQLLSKAMMQLGIMGNVGSSNPQTIIIKQYLDRKQVAEAVVTEGKIQQMSTGSNMFLLGTT